MDKSRARAYGPYSNGDRGRLLMVLWDPVDDTYSSISYPRWLMQEALGRPLRADEEVHHLDGDKTNNSLDNLVVLTEAEHKAIHAAEKVWVNCGNCGAETSNRKYCSEPCHRKGSRVVERPSREQLTQDLNSLSWSAVGRKYGVSDNAVRKWARSMGILKHTGV